MARPADGAWQPLGLTADPVPGDPERIGQEATKLASTVKTLNDQITALKKIANSQDNIGKTPDKIRSAAGDLVGDLTTVATRYHKVASALNGWIPELEQAQSMSLRALNQAEGPYATILHTPKPNLPITQGPDGLPQFMPLTTPTPAQQAEFDSYRAKMKTANQQLQDAQQLLRQATQLRDDQAKHYAGQINDASNDSLSDSWWDKFSHWVTEHAEVLKTIAKILQYVAVGLAILCLFIPGVDLLIIAALAVTAALLVVHTMLAATGNGNWLDVALDVVGLVTLGAGLGAASAVEAGEDAAVEAATEAWENGAKSLMENEFGPALKLFRSLTEEDGSLSKIGQLGVKNTMKAIADVMGEKPVAEPSLGFLEKNAANFKAAGTMWKSIIKMDDGSLPALQRLGSAFTHGGDTEIAENMQKLSGLAKSWPELGKVTDAVASGGTAVKVANAAFYSGNVTAFGDYFAGRIDGEGYEQWKDDNFSHALSGTQATALADTGNPMFEGFRVASSFMGN